MPADALLSDAILPDPVYWRLRNRLARWIKSPRTPLVLLGLVAVCGLGLRVYAIDKPAETAPGQGFIFDERYYVNAARVIAGVPMNISDQYAAQAPAGADPNGEHPQLAKGMIALGIRVLGDNPVGWRITPVLFGVASILLLYWLVRCAGGSAWMALGAAAVAAVENLWLVSSRIAVLDVYCLPFMLAGAAFYLRRQPVVAGILIGIGMCVKSFTAYVVVVLILLEVFRAVRRLLARRRANPKPALRWKPVLRRVGRPAALVAVTVAAYFSALAALDVVVPPYSSGRPVDSGQAAPCDAALVWRGACNHLVFMTSYAAKLQVSSGDQGISSYPWQFWIDQRAITYYKETKTVRSGNTAVVTTPIDFEGVISPVVLYGGWLALLANAYWAVRRRDDLSFLVIAWALGTWLPAAALSLFDHRITYLYYMVVTMPALYIAVSRLLGVRELQRWVAGLWAGLLLGDLYLHYPFRSPFGG
jgi:hypothetical protein